MRKAMIVLSIAALSIFGACGGDEEGWADSEREEFIAGCESSGSSNEMCTCIQEKLEAEYPDADDPADFDQEKVVEMTEECIDAG